MPAAGVIGEAMVALDPGRRVLEKFGGDNIKETVRNYQAYMKTIGPQRRRVFALMGTFRYSAQAILRAMF